MGIRDRERKPVRLEHQALFAAPGRRDPDASEAAMRVHIRRSVERLWQRARAEESTP